MIPDIQTGRNVYVDEHLLNSDKEYKKRIKSMVAEGFFPMTQTPEEALKMLIINDDDPVEPI